MDADWGGLETLLLAAKFVESQEQKKNQKLIEICEEYPSLEKNSYSTESASLVPTSVVTSSSSNSTVIKNIPLQNASSSTYIPESNLNLTNSVISSTVSSLSSFSNGSCPSVVVTSLPSFSPSPSLTFTFTTPTAANQTASLLRISQTPIRLPTVTSPCHQTSPLVIQRTNASYSPPPPCTLPHHPQPHQTLPNSTSTITILPQRAYTERTSNVTDIKRKLSNSGTREVHNKLEKNRRAHLKECFELLKSQVPAIQDEKKPSNLTILRTAIRYVQILRRREQELESELERLAREKILNQQKLTTLKKELSAQWDHIDFNSLLPDTVESAKVENGTGFHKDFENDGETEKIAMSDVDDSSSQIKSKGGTYYGSSSSSGSCSISPLHISSPNVVFTTSDTLPPQIHIVESSTVPFDKLSSTTVVSPLQFLPTSTLRMITDAEQPIALVQHNGNDKVSESASIPKMAVHSGNTFTIFSDSFQKVTATSNAVSGSLPHTSVSNATKLPNTSVQFTHGISIPPAVSVNHRHPTLPMKSILSQSTPNGGRNNNAVLTTLPVHSNVRNIANHSFVVTQPTSGPMLLATTSPHLPTNVMPTPLLKTVSRLQPINGHPLVVKPTMVVVSSSTAASK